MTKRSVDLQKDYLIKAKEISVHNKKLMTRERKIFTTQEVDLRAAKIQTPIKENLLTHLQKNEILPNQYRIHIRKQKISVQKIRIIHQ